LPEWLGQEAAGQHEASTQPADLQARLQAAGVVDGETLQRALEADPELRQAFNAYALQQLLAQFLAVHNSAELVEFWRGVPLDMEEPFLEAVEAQIAAAHQAGNTEVANALQQRLAGIRQIQAALGQQVDAAQITFQAALDRYMAQLQEAQAETAGVDTWQAATQAGEALLVPELAETPGVNWDALRVHLASTYNSLGNALDEHDKQQALAAFERAIALQPDFAMWRRNRAGTLIELGRLDDAAAEIEQARALEPDAERLADLDQQLQQARAQANGDADEESH
jgi:tetratricopeptide (TPR) repeat protein